MNMKRNNLKLLLCMSYNIFISQFSEVKPHFFAKDAYKADDQDADISELEVLNLIKS